MTATTSARIAKDYADASQQLHDLLLAESPTGELDYLENFYVKALPCQSMDGKQDGHVMFTWPKGKDPHPDNMVCVIYGCEALDQKLGWKK